MRIVRNILKTKSNDIFSVEPDCLVYDALEMMCERNISSILVIKNNNLMGIFTEKDYARKVILKGKSSKETLISEVMTKDPITVSPDTTIETCMLLMTNKLIRHLPVLEEGKVAGIISIGDVVKHIIEEQKEIINQLEHYITH